MAKVVKIIAIVLVTILAYIGIGYVGLRLFVRAIYAQRTCDWAIIDNIELHAQINIPKITDMDCVYNKDQNVKLARFDIDKTKVDIARYIAINKFKKIRSTIDVTPDELLVKKYGRFILIDTIDTYHTSGSYGAETWQALLDSTTARLCVVIRYED